MKALLLGVLSLGLQVLAWLPAAQAQLRPNVEQRYRQLIRDQRPQSGAILENTSYLSDLCRAAPEKAARLFRDKTELRDLVGLVCNYQDARTLRYALRAKSGAFFDDLFKEMSLWPAAEKIPAWVARYYGPQAGLRFRQALWSWDTLTPGPKGFLAAKGISAASWATMPFRDRDALMQEWAKPKVQQLLKEPAPWSPDKRRQALVQLQEFQEMLTREDLYRVCGRVDCNDLLTSGLSYLQNKALPPDLRAQLQRASQPNLSVEARLQALGRIFDDSRVPGRINPEYRKQLNQHRAPRPSEAFGPKERTLLAQLLPKAYLDQVAKSGYLVLNNYYRNHALKIVVTDVPTMALAEYDPKTKEIRIGIKEVEAWLRMNGKAAHDLLTRREVFDAFILQTSPVFFHEAIHQTQFEPSHLNPVWHNQEFEIQAMLGEVEYVLLLSRKDKRMADFIQSSSQLAKHEADLIALFREGPRKFQQAIAARYYSGYPSINATVATLLELEENQLRLFQAALAKRADRGQVNRQVTQQEVDRFFRNVQHASPAQLRQALRRQDTAFLQTVVDAMRENQKATERNYQGLQRWWGQVQSDMDRFWRQYYAPPAGRVKP